MPTDESAPARRSRSLRFVSPHSRRAYLLALVPLLTDLAESGRLPRGPREWISEVVAGALIAALLAQARSEHATVLRLARIDALTGLWNRGAFEEAVVSECARARRLAQPLTLVFLDLDRFKQVNDLVGHAEGDRLLQAVATAIGEVVRAGIDRGFRLGGDEFALLLPGSRAGPAQGVVERLRERCRLATPLWGAMSLGISAGVVELAAGESAADVLRRADRAMYDDKRALR